MTNRVRFAHRLGAVARATASANLLAVLLAGPAGAIDASIEVASAGCTTNGGPTVCNVLVNRPFTVRVSFFDISGLPDTDIDGTNGYPGFQVQLDHSGGLTFNNRPGTAEILWPQSSLPVESLGVGSNAWGDISTTMPPFQESTFTGIIVEADYTCSVPGVDSVRIKSFPGSATGTVLADDSTTLVAPSTTDPSLTINCFLPAPVPAMSPGATAFLVTLLLAASAWLLLFVARSNIGSEKSDRPWGSRTPRH